MKTKFPREEALAVVRELLPLLRPCCAPLVPTNPDSGTWFRIAGSLRRDKPEVGDIEIVYVPAFGEVKDGLFTKTGNLFDARLEELVLSRVLAMRPNKNGHFTWGQSNKLALHVASGIPIDFFATTIPCFYNYLVCRTGGKDSNLQIATSAQQRGLKWHPTHSGFEVTNAAQANHALGRNDLTIGRHVVVQREEDVFQIAGLPWLEPKDRS